MQVNHSNNTSEGQSKRLSRDDQELILVGVLLIAVAFLCFLILCAKGKAFFTDLFEMISQPSSLWVGIAGVIVLLIREVNLVSKKIKKISSGKSGAEDENADVMSPDAPISAVLENARTGVNDRGYVGDFKLSRAHSSDELVGARDCLRENDYESAQNIYKRLLKSPESRGEAEIALRLISLYLASENKNTEKMADEAEELVKCLASNDSLDTEFIRAFAPWVSKCVIPPGNNSLIFREEETETQKRLSTFFRDAIIALIFSERMSSLSEEEQRTLRQNAVTLDEFSGRFFYSESRSSQIYFKVNRNKFTENELRMKEICASLGLEDHRPVFKDEAEEEQAKADYKKQEKLAIIVIFVVAVVIVTLIISL